MWRSRSNTVINLGIRLLSRCLLIGLMVVAVLPALADDVAIPPLQARVTDLTHTLSAATVRALEDKLAAFEASKGSQMAVLIVPTTQPEAIEEYGIRVAEAWKLGRKGIDDGLLLLVAKNDHAVRIEVGYGLEGVVPDAVSKRVIAEIIVPRFRQGDFDGGVTAGIDQLIKLVEGEPLPAPKKTSNGGVDMSSLDVFLVFLLIMLGRLFNAIFGSLASAVVTAGIGFAAGYFIGGMVLGLFGAFLGFVFGLNDGRWRGGGLGGGGWGSGGGGWSSGGGGFSGGGGGFGGGGASGRW
jgi:uncharacterized protein